MNLIGAPASSSILSKYFLAFSGKSFRDLILLILLCCIYNILKISNGKSTYKNDRTYSGFDYNNTTSYFGNNVKGHYRRTKNGKTGYVRAHRRKR